MNTQVSALAGRLTQLKKGALTLAAGAVLGLSSFAASAVDVNFVGYTSGCFSLACPPIDTGGAPTTVTLAGSGLTYDNAVFDVTTSGGFVSIGSIVPGVNNLGSFSLTGDPFLYFGNTFELLVTFTVPTGVGPAASYHAGVTGFVTSTGVGGVAIIFSDSPQSFTFDGGGSFDFTVNNVSVNPGETINLSGFITAAVSPIPEPETYALFMAGLAAIGFMARRRKR